MSEAAGARQGPRDEEGVAAAVFAAYQARAPLEVVGGGTKLGMLRPVQAAQTLSLAALSGVTLYSPGELVVSALAGTPMAELDRVLAERGQCLASEVPDLRRLLGSAGEPTLGGAVATNLSGPRRIAAGATRDFILGVRAVNGVGEVLRSGGRVHKNVTGLDLCRLLAGSHGTLAVLTEVTLKVLPLPEREQSLVLHTTDAKTAVAALAAGLGSPFAVSGAAYVPQALAHTVPGLSQAAALLRVENFAESVPYRVERLRALLAPFGAVEVLDEAQSRQAWRALRDAWPLVGEEGAVWRLSLRPSAGPAVAARLERETGGSWFLDWGGGLVWLAAAAEERCHDSVCRAVQDAGGTWTLMRAPQALRQVVAVIPPEAEALARIGARVKAAFDPAGILNPGRMRAGG